MTIPARIRAVFIGGVFRPVGTVNLPDNVEVAAGRGHAHRSTIVAGIALLACACDAPHGVARDSVGGSGGSTTSHADTGGASGSGGLARSGNAGQFGVAEVDDVACDSSHAVQFAFSVDAPSNYCTTSYHGVKISILNGGQRVSTISESLCERNRCSECRTTAPGCFGIQPSQQVAPEKPYTTLWKGESYVTGTCGVEGIACDVRRCLPPGTYEAEYCLAPRGEFADCDLLTTGGFLPATACVKVPFTLPVSGVVSGSITSTGIDGGA